MPLTSTTRRTIEIAAFCAALLLAALIFHAWLAAHDDQLRLASTLATQKQALDAAEARERDRNATLKDALAQIDTLKRNGQNETPAQLARALQDALQLPQPITISPAPLSNDAHAPDVCTAGLRPAPLSSSTTAAPLSNDAHAPDSRTAGVPPAPLPQSTTQQQNPQNSPQETERHKSLLDLLFYRDPSAKSSVNSASVEPGQTPPSSPNTQSENAASPQSQQGTAASLPAPNSSVANQAPSTGAKTAAPRSTAEIPTADLAPLYNYVQDCRACQLQLAAAKQNASDDAAKIRALTLERDAAITAAKGGPFWLRLKRNAHWLAIGAAVGAVTSAAALCHTGHCR
ncbi:MAG: hypothetical protein WBQ04_19605 [Candidatus Acidiferrales bacterium]